jgi:hypothetical protein
VEWDEERKRLYLHEFGIDTVAVYDVAADYSLSNRRGFANVPACDGITLDERGDVYSVSYTTGVVHVHDPDGKKLGEIAIAGQQLTNLAFGGPDFKTLFFITNRGLYKLPMKVKGYKSGQPSISIAAPFRARAGWSGAEAAWFRADGRRLPAVFSATRAAIPAAGAAYSPENPSACFPLGTASSQRTNSTRDSSPAGR